MRKFRNLFSFIMACILITSNIVPAYADTNRYNKDKVGGNIITYSVTNYFQNYDGSFSAEETVSCNGEEFDVKDIMAQDREGFKTPEMQTVELHDGVSVEFYYYRWIYVEVNHYKVENGKNVLVKKDSVSNRGIDGETISIPFIDIEGYKEPAKQSVTLSLGKQSVVDYYYTLKPKAKYNVYYTYFDPVSKCNQSFIEEEEKIGYVGDQVTPPIYSIQEIYNMSNGAINLECYVAPTQTKTITITEDGNASVTYYYDKVSGYCTVFHYIQKPDKSYILKNDDTEKVMGAIGSKVTPKPNEYAGYEVPAEKTVEINKYDSVFVSYYYDIDPNYTGKLEEEEEEQEEEEEVVLDVGEIFSYNKFDFIVTSSKKKQVAVEAVPNRKTISIPSVVKHEGVEYTVTGIGSNSFLGHKKVATVIIPESVQTIGKSAFKNCKALKKVSFKGAGLKYIKGNAFYGCSKLQAITIGSKVKTIGAKAFYNCSSLKKIIFKGKTKFETSSFKGINKEANIKLPKAHIEYYKKQFKKVEDYITVNIGNLK